MVGIKGIYSNQPIDISKEYICKKVNINRTLRDRENVDKID